MTSQSTAQRFRFIADALNAAGGFSDGGYLVQYGRESTAKFQKRQEIAHYENHLARVTDQFVGYLTKKTPVRTLTNPLFKKFADDADFKGRALDVVLADFMKDAKARGSMLLLVENVREVPSDAGSQLERRAIPYLVPIPPEDVVGYAKNDLGRLVSVSINAKGIVNGDYRDVVRTWTLQKWFVCSSPHPGKLEPDPAIILDQGEHGLGVCPVLVFTEKGSFPHVGKFAQIADISKRLYNLQSELDEILRAQTFSILAYPVNGDVSVDVEKVSSAIGTHNMLLCYGGMAQFIAPPSGPAEVYQRRIEALEKRIDEIGLVVEQSSAPEAGVALAMKFQALNSALIDFAGCMEDLERQIWDVVSRWLGGATPPDIAWHKDYSLADVGREIQILQQMQEVGAPPTYEREKKKQIIVLDMPGLEEETKQRIFSEIDEGKSEIATPADDALPQAEDDGTSPLDVANP